MPKTTTAQSLDAIISDAIAGIVSRAVDATQKAVASQIALEVQRSAKPTRAAGRGALGAKTRRRVRPVEMTKWVADRRARRVPNFVIEMTGGLDTTKKIVAKYGENAAFEKGKPAPATLSQLPKPEAEKMPAKAKPPAVRKKAAAAK